MSEISFISSTEAAKRLKVSLRTIHLWADKGDLLAWKTPGGHRKIALSSVQSMEDEKSRVVNTKENLPRIVVIEDDSTQRKLYRSFFKNMDLPVEVYLSDNGYSGLIAIGTYHPELVITDIKMPNMDGFQMIREIRKQPDLENLDIIIVSSMDKEDIKEHDYCKDYTFLQKPIDYETFSSYIKQTLNITKIS